MKYVMLEDPLGRTYPILFDDELTHADARFLGRDVKAKVRSAGFYYLDHEQGVVTTGESETLKTVPHPDDAWRIASMLGGLGLLDAMNVAALAELKKEKE